MALLSTITAFDDKDPVGPTHFNTKLLSLISNIVAVNNQYGSGWFNVTDPQFGANGDGVTDDTASIRSAIAACSGTGGTVFFPIGQYLITSTLTVQSAMQFLGSGRSTVITLGSGMGRIGILVQGTTSFDTVAWFEMRDLGINGNASGPNDAGLCQMNNVDRLVVMNCHLFNSGSTSSSNGIAVSTGNSSTTAIATRGVIAFNLVEGHSKAGINWSTNASDGLILGNTVRHNAGTGYTPGIQVNGGHEVSVIGNSVYSNEGRGIYVATVGTTPPTPSRHVEIIGNNVYGNGLSSVTEGAGIAVLNSATTIRFGRTIVANNNVHDNGGPGVDAGIMVQNQDNVIVNGNVVAKSGNHGIFVDAARYITVTNNQCHSNNTGGNSSVAGITLRGVADAIIMGNISTDSQTTPTQDYGLTFFSGSTCSRIQVIGNNFSGNSTGAILEALVPQDSVTLGNIIAATVDSVRMGAFGGLASSVSGLRSALTTVTANYTATVRDQTIAVLSSSTVTVTLPAASTVTGQLYDVKRMGTQTVVVNATSGSSFDGSATVSILTQYDALQAQSYGTGYLLRGLQTPSGLL